jgi:ribonuclease P protein component
MLPAAHRLRSSSDFAAVTRRGRRVRSGGVVVYLLRQGAAGGDRQVDRENNPQPARPARVGMVVGKSVGNSVVRHRVARRIRAQVGERLNRLPADARVVVRALPQTAAESSVQLGHDLERAFDRLTSRPVSSESS